MVQNVKYVVLLFYGRTKPTSEDELEIPGIMNHKPRCANRLKIFDDRMECDQSDEEEERSDSRGPHVVYIAYGKWCPAFRP